MFHTASLQIYLCFVICTIGVQSAGLSQDELMAAFANFLASQQSRNNTGVVPPANQQLQNNTTVVPPSQTSGPIPALPLPNNQNFQNPQPLVNPQNNLPLQNFPAGLPISNSQNNFPGAQQVPLLYQQAPGGSSRITKSATDFGQTVVDYGAHGAERILTNAGEVVKGTDRVMNESSTQFKRVNSGNSQLIRQALMTKGAAATKASKTGIGALNTVENIINNPMSYINPLSYVQAILAAMPWSRQSEEEQLIQLQLASSLGKLRDVNSELYYRLIQDSPEVYNWLKAHPIIFLRLLNDIPQLVDTLNNPIILNELRQQEQTGRRM